MGIQENMAAAMRALKAARGKSLEELSEELEVSRSALQEYLSGNGNPTISTVNHLAQRLQVDPSFLISGAYTGSQLEVLLRLLDFLQIMAELSCQQRRRIAEKLMEIIQLWTEEGVNADEEFRP